MKDFSHFLIPMLNGEQAVRLPFERKKIKPTNGRLENRAEIIFQ
jgi:hypothetical protein